MIKEYWDIKIRNMPLNNVFESFALVGGLVTAAAYLPQISRLIKAKDSTGNSLLAWYAWFIGTLLPLTYAFYIKNEIFIILQAIYALFIGITIIFIYRYRRLE